jgi:signal transduction histidine kinase
MAKDDKVNILLVDDQPGKLLSYEVILNELGENLIKAGSAREALEHLLRREIALVVADVSMPDLDGFELAGMIREHPRFERTAIIFVSGIHLSDQDLLRGYQAGAADYVPVPVVPELLRAKVKVFAELYRKTRQLEAMNAELEHRVAERTAELAKANAVLEERVEERTREREAALAQVHEMQKMESIGQLTGGIAHDFNNLLMVVLGNLNLLKRRLPDDATSTRLIDGAITGAERGATLTKRMLAFARRQELRPENVDLRELVGGMAEFLRRSIGPSIHVTLSFSTDLPAVRVDPNQLELALLNLVLNARDAMPDGGRLGIEARRGIDAANLPSLARGDYVCIAVTDSGCGMDEATLQRATEPFYTTKGIGKGTGLGLSMVHGLAAQSGGAMKLSSRVGEGSIVKLWFPVADAPRTHSFPAQLSAEPVTQRSCSVLVVDDDVLISASTAAMLEDGGHAVVEAASGQRALEILRLGTKVDVVITDQGMPHMSGLELVRQIRRYWPMLPVILASGYAEIPASEELRLPRLAKPYQQAELLALVTKVLDFVPDATNIISFDSARHA